MSLPRIVAYADTLNGKIFVTGGSDGAIAYNSVEVFDPSIGWTLSPATMHYPRGFHACVNWNGELFVLGGTNLSAPVLDKVEHFDPVDEAWVDFAPMIYARRKFGAAVLGEYLYAIGGGGTNGQYMTTVERYKTASVTDGMTKVVSVQLHQNTPNPFSIQTTITYELKSPADVLLQVFDLSGRVVATLFDGRQGAGEYSVTWDAAGMPAGIYCYRLQTNEGVVTRKCVLQ